MIPGAEMEPASMGRSNERGKCIVQAQCWEAFAREIFCDS